MSVIPSLQGVNKSFGPIDVLHDITQDVKAGKSTVIRLLSGVHQPTSGQMVMDGKPVTFRTPREAADHGIVSVDQFGGTFPLISIGREPTRGVGPFKIDDRRRANEIAVKAVQNFGITRIDDGGRLVGDLSGVGKAGAGDCKGEEITDLMAGGASMAALEAEIAASA